MRKQDRYKAAVARDEALKRAGQADEILRSELEAVRKEKSPADWRATVERVRHDARRPSSQYHQQALVTLGEKTNSASVLGSMWGACRVSGRRRLIIQLCQASAARTERERGFLPARQLKRSYRAKMLYLVASLLGLVQLPILSALTRSED